MSKFSDWVELAGHFAWPATLLVLCFLIKKQIRETVDAIAKRVADRSSHVKINKSGIEIKTLDEANPELAKIESIQQPTNRSETEDEKNTETVSFADERNAIYGVSRQLFLVHVLEPTTRPNQAFDLFIYLISHKGGDLGSVRRADFYFGKHWGNKVFEGKQVGSVIGVRTAAYGPFLCTCRITFTDGEHITVSRYIDFEMSKLVSMQDG